MSVGLPKPQLPSDLFGGVHVDEKTGAAEHLGVYTSKWLLRRASGYSKRLATVVSSGGGCCGNGGCGSEKTSGCGSLKSYAPSLPPDFRGKTVLVLGAGDTAMDCATAALRCGARRVRVVFRRGTPDVRAVPEELENVVRERCELVPHAQPIRFIFRKAEDGGRVRAVQFRRTDADPDATDDGGDGYDLFVLRADCVISAFGSKLSPEGNTIRIKI